MRIALPLSFLLALIGTLQLVVCASDPPPPPFPPAFTVMVEVSVPNHSRPILYRTYYDAFTNRTRLDSWGISNETLLHDGSRPPPLYFFVFLYNEQKLLSYLPAPDGMRCTATKLSDSFPAPGPDLSSCVYKGTTSVDGISCNVWAGVDSAIGDFVYAASEIASLPVQIATPQNGTRQYSEFNLTQPDDAFFHPAIPCSMLVADDTGDAAQTANSSSSSGSGEDESNATDNLSEAITFMRQVFDVVAGEAAHAVGGAVALANALQQQQTAALSTAQQLLHSVLRSWLDDFGHLL